MLDLSLLVYLKHQMRQRLSDVRLDIAAAAAVASPSLSDGWPAVVHSVVLLIDFPNRSDFAAAAAAVAVDSNLDSDLALEVRV